MDPITSIDNTIQVDDPTKIPAPNINEMSVNSSNNIPHAPTYKNNNNNNNNNNNQHATPQNKNKNKKQQHATTNNNNNNNINNHNQVIMHPESNDLNTNNTVNNSNCEKITAATFNIHNQAHKQALLDNKQADAPNIININPDGSIKPYVRWYGIPAYPVTKFNQNGHECYLLLINIKKNVRKFLNISNMVTELNKLFGKEISQKIQTRQVSRTGLIKLYLKADSINITNLSNLVSRYWFPEAFGEGAYIWLAPEHVTLFTGYLNGVSKHITNWEILKALQPLNILSIQRLGSAKGLSNTIRVIFGDVESINKFKQRQQIAIHYIKIRCSIPSRIWNSAEKKIISTNNNATTNKTRYIITTCKKCWKTGHTARICPSSKYLCRFCGSGKHNSNRCPRHGNNMKYQCNLCKGNHKSCDPVLCPDIKRIRAGIKWQPKQKQNNRNKILVKQNNQQQQHRKTADKQTTSKTYKQVLQRQSKQEVNIPEVQHNQTDTTATTTTVDSDMDMDNNNNNNKNNNNNNNNISNVNQDPLEAKLETIMTQFLKIVDDKVSKIPELISHKLNETLGNIKQQIDKHIQEQIKKQMDAFKKQFTQQITKDIKIIVRQQSTKVVKHMLSDNSGDENNNPPAKKQKVNHIKKKKKTKDTNTCSLGLLFSQDNESNDLDINDNNQHTNTDNNNVTSENEEDEL